MHPRIARGNADFDPGLAVRIGDSFEGTCINKRLAGWLLPHRVGPALVTRDLGGLAHSPLGQERDIYPVPAVIDRVQAQGGGGRKDWFLFKLIACSVAD